MREYFPFSKAENQASFDLHRIPPSLEVRDVDGVRPEFFSNRRSYSPHPEYLWMRANLPYGVWTCADGTKQLFNRDYVPLWTKTPGEAARRAEAHVSWVSERYYFNDDNPPWRGNRVTLAFCCLVLRSFVAGAQ